MNLLAIVGSPRKGKATDRLVDQAIEGALAGSPDGQVRKLHLLDHHIQFCRNCLACRDSKTDAPYAKCSLRDDMDQICEDIVWSDRLILGTPVHMGGATGVMTTFLERICWTFAKPEGKQFVVERCPVPRSAKARKAAIIVVSGIVPPLFRRFCDDATSLIKVTIRDSLNARTVGDMYAGAVENRGVERYLDQARKLGRRLA
ncbi:MAG: flavodoxin family protein [Deltaproteobacteria bacterium]|nr:flavodoxin family protein [Deltaproteobacteria bacterium]